MRPSFSLFLITVILFGAAAGALMCLGSSENALSSFGYVTLEKRRESHGRNLVNKFFSNNCPQFFMRYFNYNRDILPRRTTWSSDKFRLPFAKLECTKKAFLSWLCSF